MKPDDCFQGLLTGTAQRDAFSALREQAEVRARTLKLPQDKHDDWRLTGLEAFYDQEFFPAGKALQIPSIEGFMIPGSCRIVFVDGFYHSKLSDLSGQEGIRVSPLGQEDKSLHTHFDKGMKDSVFAQINGRNFTDCAWVHVQGETQQIVHVLHVTTGHQKPISLYGRALVVLGAMAKATLVEEYTGPDSPYLVNTMTEVVLGEGADLRHIRIQREGAQAVHMGHALVSLSRGAHYDSTTLALGGRFSRHDQRILHQGEGAEARLDGLILADENQVADTHTRIDHLVPDCRSFQQHKCIASGNSTAVFSGNIVVHRGARGTDTRQSSRNLLLSNKARIDAQPQLEIMNDDVSCKHGATMGKLDAEELFYFMSRGLQEAQARKLLIYAFAAEIMDRIPIPNLVRSLRESMEGRLV
ncbi:MAG: Fe-S cluster assembly protein SufD [Ferrovum myxofaciens]|uniref:Fe-S cluster assembly protein SufD n=1 Tax=Ferrovum myxofaciens TaxID=416213 RepID=UPI002352A55B|nr:Fe-S cluster assembly protein SufD [Ferrovum myxofaciens]QKE42166.1 MAG: Fe-S cluster assembly protein SufD [Ferrovum myxofaciens]